MAVERTPRSGATLKVTMQDAATAIGNGRTVDVREMEKGAIEVDIGGGGTVVFEASVGGTAWNVIEGVPQDDLTAAESSVTASNTIHFDNLAGINTIRARVAAVTDTIIATGLFWG